MMEVLFPVLLVAGIGLVAGLGLAIASAVMAVPKDEKAETIQEMLPGANCGACELLRLLRLTRPPSQRARQNRGSARRAARRLPPRSRPSWALAAWMWRRRLPWCAAPAARTTPGKRCAMPASRAARPPCSLRAAPSSCSFGCVGFGDCVKACQYGAVEICSGVAHIDSRPLQGLLAVRFRLPEAGSSPSYPSASRPWCGAAAVTRAPRQTACARSAASAA